MNNIVNKLGGSGSSSGHTQQPMGQKDDYGDKVANTLDKKFNGGKIGHNNMEKVTDGVRHVYEKTTGKHVNPKFSN